MRSLEWARIDWDETPPRSLAFDDGYGPREGHLRQAQEVFLEGNDVPDRCRRGGLRVVGELGFGLGVNAALVAETWRRLAPPGAALDYLAVEAFPLQLSDLSRLPRRLPRLAWFWRRLAELGWIDAVPGVHRFLLLDGRFRLTLHLGPVGEVLPGWTGPVDAWFLDGFAPRVNPDMWSPAVFEQVGRLSRPGTTVATWSVAGLVRRGLSHVGFDVDRVPGRMGKAQVLRGVYRRPGDERMGGVDPSKGPVAVIGAGIAGVSAAAGLARRGFRVDLYDRGRWGPAGASKLPLAVLHPRLTAGPTPLMAASAAGLGWTRRCLAAVEAAGGEPLARWCGVFRPAEGRWHRERCRKALAAWGGLEDEVASFVDPAEASSRLGVPAPAGLFFGRSGIVALDAFVRRWRRQAEAVTFRREEIARLRRRADHWTLVDSGGRPRGTAALVVLATAGMVEALWPPGRLPLGVLRGQALLVPAVEASPAVLGAVWMGSDCLVTPALGGVHLVGATFDRGETDLTPRPEQREQLVAAAESVLGRPLPRRHLRDWVGLRSVSRDRLPLVGPLAEDVDSDWGSAGRRLSRRAPSSPASVPWVVTGFGSLGLLLAPLAGELLASMVEGRPLPLAASVAASLHPARFAAPERRSQEPRRRRGAPRVP